MVHRRIEFVDDKKVYAVIYLLHILSSEHMKLIEQR